MSGEKMQVLARLTGRETVSRLGAGIDLTARGDQDAAVDRIVRELNVPAVQAALVYASLIRHLQESNLTTNFVAYKFFNRKPSGSGYVNQFEGGNRWGGDTYITTRDNAEETMFDYRASNGIPSGMPMAVVARGKSLGMLAGPEFEPSVRPKYAALNYARLKYGASANWGKSFMVLKEHVKHDATYVHTDSFDVAAGKEAWRVALPGQIATFTQMARLLANMSPTMLKALHAAEQGRSFGDEPQVPGLGDTQYIEAQVHGEIRFDRDIAMIVISAAEMMEAQIKTQGLVAAGDKRFKVVTPEKLRDTFHKFSRKYCIPVLIN